MNVHRNGPGKYLIEVGCGPSIKVWRVWRGLNGRWYGESKSHPDAMIDAPTFRMAKYDIQHGFFARSDKSLQTAGETAIGMRGYRGSPAEWEDRNG